MEIRSRFLKFSATVKPTTDSVNALTVILDLETKPGGLRACFQQAKAARHLAVEMHFVGCIHKKAQGI